MNAARVLFIICFLLISAALAKPAEAATLYVAPSGGTHRVGETFAISIYVSSEDQAINAVSGVINISKEKLEIVSLTTGGSIVNLWVREPSYSFSSGKASFEGIVLNPGYTGSGGRIVTVTVRAVGSGIATVNFDSGVVLANDGRGTNILLGMGNAQFTISGETLPPQVEPDEEEEEEEKEKPRPPPERPAPSPPGVPAVLSETHPDSNAWYSANDVKISWSVPDGATGVRLLASRNPDDAPSVMYDSPISSIELNDLGDGVWYLHVQIRTGTKWGDAAHFRFQIDTERPSVLELTQVEREDATEPIVRFDVNATDTTSGIDHYVMLVDDQIVKERIDGSLTSFSTPILEPGEYTVTIRAVDRVGNETEASDGVTIEPLEAPIILQYPKTLSFGDAFFVRGVTQYPNAFVTLWIQAKGYEPAPYEFVTDGRGQFAFVTKDHFPAGQVAFWIFVTDERGAKSLPSDRVTIIVERMLISDLLPWICYILILIIGVLIYLLWKNWHTAALFKRRSREGDEDEYDKFTEELRDLRREIELEKKTYKAMLAEHQKIKKAVGKGKRRRTSKLGALKRFITGSK